MAFEENMKKLEESVAELEKGELPLQETMKRFEEGLVLAKACEKELDAAHQKIEKIIGEHTEDFQPEDQTS